MLEIAFFAIAIAVVYRGMNRIGAGRPANVAQAKKLSPQLLQLLAHAERLLHEKKFLAAEKAYLNVLKVDHKNVEAYRRLGIIYTALKNYDDAIESLQIAAQLKPSATAFYALGLVFLENGNHIKSIASLEKSIMFEPSVARYHTLYKAYLRVANYSKAMSALERIVDLEPTKPHLLELLDACVLAKDKATAEQTARRILDIDPTDPKANRIIKQFAPQMA